MSACGGSAVGGKKNEIHHDDLFLGRFRSDSQRLPGWDYASPGFYFVTICVKYKPYFGRVKNGIMELSEIGEIARKQWLKTETMRNNVKFDEWIIMPNHIHAIIIIKPPIPVSKDCISVETHCNASLQIDKPNKKYKNKFGPQKNNLSSIIRGFKSSVKRICNENNLVFLWQPKFYDHIIRNQYSLNRIRNYIKKNPENWERDRNNNASLWM